ncbi:Diaminopimelate epimerase [hydrothermal vent metagenome]|uniref:Diaminopimelate epimerase n=1 Tax=hydrothermal vent metagenome TaxID=652676 RepID=A0A3B0WEH9_9ZZZZ
MKYNKYHALGNDYIVVDPKDLDHEITTKEIIILCNRHYGIGSDGILYGPLKSKGCDFSLKIFNPDASEAEKSGNGLRIFSRYLWDCNLVNSNTFSIETKGGNVSATVHDDGKSVSVDMGKVRFTHEPVGSPRAQAKTISVIGKRFEFYVANVGNPHCVILVDDLSPEIAIKYGSLIENDSQFENRTNVQFLKIIDRNTIQIEIWERGAGYTLASGSSSTASAAVAHELGFCGSNISVNMPGGIIEISLNTEFEAIMKGAVCKIGTGNLSSEALESF